MGEGTVYVAGQGTGGPCDTYHTDPDCRALQKARSVFEYSRENIGGTREECRVCRGEVSRPPSNDRSHYKALIDHG